ncbi:MAG TPA: HK97 family phage prohead protease [Candidatus Dwaynia gallinarum]|nr:HK97 family phage prohead protease [Candidatus Dwaynia gallinarum]
MEDMSIKRSFEITYRAKKDSEKKVIQGYAVVFDSWTDISSWGEIWKECIRKGAFTQSLKKNSILALYNHDFNNVLARKDVNMKLVEDDKGLYFEIELPDTTQGNDLYELIDKGIVNQCSFSGYVRKNLWSEDNGGNVLREILEIDLIEITITPIPAYEVTEAEVKRSREIKSTKENKEDKLDFEEIIRESKRKLKEIRESERELNER